MSMTSLSRASKIVSSSLNDPPLPLESAEASSGSLMTGLLSGIFFFFLSDFLMGDEADSGSFI